MKKEQKKNILQGAAGNQIGIMSGFLEECYRCHKSVHFPVLIRACSLIQLSLPICLFVSHHTSATLLIPPQNKHLDQFRPTLSFGPLPVGPLICTEYHILPLL